MNEATHLGNWDEFQEIFGASADSYTADSVYGFFKNGGTERWMVRIAHCAPKGELPGLDHAACAEHVQIDDWNKPSLKIRALNEGTWGNMIWFRCVHTSGATALLTRDLDIGADLRPRELRLHRDHRGRRQDHQVGDGDAGHPAPSRGGADVPRGAHVRD